MRRERQMFWSLAASLLNAGMACVAVFTNASKWLLLGHVIIAAVCAVNYKLAKERPQ